MAFLPLDTIKLFIDLFDVIYLRYHKVKKINFNRNGMQKIYIIDNNLILLVSILKNNDTIALNEKELFQKAHGRGNRFIKIPSKAETYYHLEIEELTPNTVNFEFVEKEYIDRLEMLTGIYYLDLDVNYIRFRGWKHPYWDRGSELVIEKVNRLMPELKLKDRYKKWKGVPYHFAIIKLPCLKPVYAVAYFRADPSDYLDRFTKRYKKYGTISSEIRGERGFTNSYHAFPKLIRQRNLNKMVVAIQNHHFREKDDVWRYADKLLLKARNGDFEDNFQPLTTFLSTPKPKPQPEIDLNRFLEAQNFAYYGKNGKLCDTNYKRAIKELKKGQKQTHWMWFIFPQLKGLGWSEYANKYGIRSIHEAIAYYEHPILGPRLEEAVKTLLKIKKDVSVLDIFGDVDALKLRSCLTLFLEVDPDNRFFSKALNQFFDGSRDEKTLKLLRYLNPDEEPDY